MGSLAAVPPYVSEDRVWDFDIFDTLRSGADVHDAYAAALATTPGIFWTPRNGGHWVARTFDVISGVIRDPLHFSARERRIPRMPTGAIHIPRDLDPPDNLPYRQALAPRVSPMAVRRLEPTLRARAAEVVEAVAARGACDFSQEVAARFASAVVMDLLDVPEERRGRIHALLERYATRLDIRATELEAEIEAHVNDLIVSRRAEPAGDFIGRLIGLDFDGRRLVNGELLSMCSMLVYAALDPLAGVSGFAIHRLSKEPDLQARLTSDTGLVAPFIEEALRLYGCVSTSRVVAKDCERFGASFRTGDMVACLLPLAGYDERVNPHPTEFNLDRLKKRHLAFSAGPHHCLGEPLARAGLAILTSEWLRRIPAFGPGGDNDPVFRLGEVSTISALPLRWPAPRSRRASVANRSAVSPA